MVHRSIEVTIRARWLCHLGSIICSLLLPLQGAAVAGVPVGHIGSHGLERDLVYADGTGEGAGYFTFIEGIPGPFFDGLPSEASEVTAFFTFRTDKFSTGVIVNGNVKALLHPPGHFTIYLNTAPNGNWNNFNTFSTGQRIAIVEFGTTQDINTGSVQIGYTSAKLSASRDFEFQGHRFNLNDLFPHGVTIAFITNPTPISANPFTFSLGFTTFAIGADTDQTE